MAVEAQLFMLEGLALAFLLAQLGLSAGDTSHMQNCYSGINLDNLELGLGLGFRVRVSKGASHCISSEPLDLFLIGFFMQYSLAKSKENVVFKNLIAARVQ